MTNDNGLSGRCDCGSLVYRLAASPLFILLDEPFAGIDPIAVADIQRIIAYLKRRGLGILITDHNVRETLRITDRAYIIREGEVFRDGTPRALATDPEVRRVYLGDDFDLMLPESRT